MDWVTHWLDLDFSRVSLPPFCMEIVLFDGQHFFVQTVIGKDKEADTYCISIWDLRAISEADIEELKNRINEKLKSRDSGFGSAQDLYPELDRANLCLHRGDIRYCVQWHNRFWPEGIGKQIGFLPSK